MMEIVETLESILICSSFGGKIVGGEMELQKKRTMNMDDTRVYTISIIDEENDALAAYISSLGSRLFLSCCDKRPS